MKLISTQAAASILGIHRSTLWWQRVNGHFEVEPVLTVGNHSLWDEAKIRAEAAKKTGKAE